MSRIDFGWCLLENVEELLLSMFLCAWARACVCNLYSCVHSSVLAYAGVFLSFCVRGNGPTYAGSCLCAWALTRVHEMPSRSLALSIFTAFFNRFTSTCNFNAYSCHFCTQLSLYHSFHLHSHIKTPHFLNLSSIMNLMTSFFFCNC